MNRKPRFSIQPRRRSPPRARHHNPGTRRRADTRRVRLLSSIIIQPPQARPMPIPSTSSREPRPPVPIQVTNEAPSTPIINLISPDVSPQQSETSWRTPASLEMPPTHSPDMRNQRLIPTPTVQYGEEFKIIPGPACQPVPVYVNRNVPWRNIPIDAPVQRKVHFYRSDIRDPRMHDLRVEVTPLTPAAPMFDQQAFESLFEELAPPNTSAPLFPPPVQRVPAPQPLRERVPEQQIPSTSTGESTSISEELRALLRISKLFAGRASTPSASRKRKRSHHKQ